MSGAVEWSSKGWRCRSCGSDGHDYVKEFHAEGCDGTLPTMAKLADEVRALIAADADYARVGAKVEEMELLAERLPAEQR